MKKLAFCLSASLTLLLTACGGDSISDTDFKAYADKECECKAANAPADCYNQLGKMAGEKGISPLDKEHVAKLDVHRKNCTN